MIYTQIDTLKGELLVDIKIVGSPQNDLISGTVVVLLLLRKGNFTLDFIVVAPGLLSSLMIFLLEVTHWTLCMITFLHQDLLLLHSIKVNSRPRMHLYKRWVVRVLQGVSSKTESVLVVYWIEGRPCTHNRSSIHSIILVAFQGLLIHSLSALQFRECVIQFHMCDRTDRQLMDRSFWKASNSKCKK